MKLFFTGIGGIGMSGLAQLCLDQGFTVQGSEQSQSPVCQVLEQKGVQITYRQSAANITTETEILIYTEAIPKDHPERMAARDLGILEKSYFEFLGLLAQKYRLIAVAGTHGKTTTVGLIASGLIEAGQDPTVLVGATLDLFGGANYKKGYSDWLVVEACEYRNNFQYLKPEVVVLTNVEWDHPDFYQTEDQYFETMADFCRQAAVVVSDESDPEVRRLWEDYIGYDNEMSLHDQIEAPTPIDLFIPGQHNQANAQLALKLAKLMEVETDRFIRGLEDFEGASRRQEFIGSLSLETQGKTGSVMVYDDYGHHPTEVRVTLEAFRDRYPDSKIALIYEAHQFSRTKQFLSEFKNVLAQPDILGVFPIYEARDSADDLASVNRTDLLDSNPQSLAVDIIEDVHKILTDLNDGDILLFMGAGRISAFAREVVQNT